MVPPAPRTPAASLGEQVDFEALDLFARSPVGLASGFLPLGMSVALLQQLSAPPGLWPWSAAVASVLLGGLGLVWAYRRAGPGPATSSVWRRRFLVLTATGGLVWGAAGWWLVPAPWPAEMYVFVLLAALSAAVLADVGANLDFFVAFVGGAWSPTVIGRALMGGPLNLGLSFGALMTCAMLMLLAARLTRATRRALRIAHDNRQLVQALEQRSREAETASLAKSRFIAAASHDLRQPVHALGLLLDVLQGQRLDAAQQRTAGRMAQVLESLEGLFEGLLDISKLDAGAVQARIEDFALGPLLNGLASEFAAEAESKGLQLRRRTHGVDDAWVRSDPLLLERMLRNLLANAIRFTSAGGVLIVCRRRGGSLRIDVFDTGTGIAPQLQVAVFDEFFQARDRTQGLGLGLAIVKRLGRLLDHAVELRSRPGRGTRISIEVPRAAPQPAPRPATAREPPGAQPDWAGRTIVVVDDDPLARDALGRWLQAWGCRVAACADAAAARTAIDREDGAAPAALLTDWRLPGGEDGLGVIQAARQRHGPALPAILITGDALEDARGLALQQGVVLLHKPVRPAALRAALNACMSPADEAADEVGS